MWGTCGRGTEELCWYITRSDCNNKTHLGDHEDVSALAHLAHPVPLWVNVSDVPSVYLLACTC